jgi:hypothetical protein
LEHIIKKNLRGFSDPAIPVGAKADRSRHPERKKPITGNENQQICRNTATWSFWISTRIAERACAVPEAEGTVPIRAASMVPEESARYDIPAILSPTEELLK